MTKKILIVGVLDKEGSTNIEMADGFRQLGYSVEEYNYRTKLNELGLEGMHSDFFSLINGRKFDLQVFCKTNQMHPRTLQDAKDSGPTWYWFMDNFEVCRQINAAGYAANASFASASASNVAERFKLLNNNAHHIFEGYNPKLYFREDLPKIHEFLFIGNATIPRIIKIQDLIRSGMRISIFGSGWPVGMMVHAPVFGEDERIEINSAKVVLNLCHDDTIFSDRVAKALACGANVITQRCKDLQEMVKWFTDIPEEQTALEETEADWIAIVNEWWDFANFTEDMVIFRPQINIDEYMRNHHSWASVCAGMMEKVSVCESTVR